MDIKENNNNESTDNQKKSEEPSNTKIIANNNEELNKEPKEEIIEEKPAKKVRRQATEDELSNPLHGVKLVQLLERLVEHYGWEYLGKRTNIRCFIYNPTMKSSLGFLRKTTWAREFVEDIYLEMMKGRQDQKNGKK